MGRGGGLMPGTISTLVWKLLLLSCCFTAGNVKAERSCGGDTLVEILHPSEGQVISAGWQDLMIVSLRCRGPLFPLSRLPEGVSIAVYVNDLLAARTTEIPTFFNLPPLRPGNHTFFVAIEGEESADGERGSQVAEREIFDWHEISAFYAERDGGVVPPLHKFEVGGFPPTIAASLADREGEHQQVDKSQEGARSRGDQEAAGSLVGVAHRELTVIWTCPDWEQDWISEILQGANLSFSIHQDPSFTLPPSPPSSSVLVAVSENNLRNNPPSQLAEYLLRLIAGGSRVGVLHMSDEGYTSSTFFYPWVHYVIRNHWSESVSLLPHILAIPLGYKKGFKRAPVPFPPPDREYVWSFVGQTHDKPTRMRMIEVASRLPGGMHKITHQWDDPHGFTTDQYRLSLLKTRYALCPRGFVHPESFRIWEALESGSVPITEPDEYLERLLSPMHPIPSLPVPPGCPRRTTLGRAFVEEYALVGEAGGMEVRGMEEKMRCMLAAWEGVSDMIEELERAEGGWEELRARVVGWWEEHKRWLMGRVRRLVMGCGKGDVNCTVGVGAVYSSGVGLAEGREVEVEESKDSRADETARLREMEGRRDEGLVAEAAGEGVQEACSHHDLRCWARYNARLGLVTHAVLEGQIGETRRRAKSLFDDGWLQGEEGGNGGTTRQAESGRGVKKAHRDVMDLGSWPGGECTDACDCPGHLGCTMGVCTGEAKVGECGREEEGVFERVLVVSMNRTGDVRRWHMISSQLSKYGLPVERFPAVDGSLLTSPLVQALLNDGTISPQHDSLVFDVDRSVIGCALSHLAVFAEISASHSGGWTLILEDDALLPPHFTSLLSSSWSRLPASSPTPDVVYLGVGSNGREPLEWLNRRVMRPSQTVGTHAYAVTGKGAARLLAGLRPLHQSIDSQIHETLLGSISILALSTPDPPAGTSVFTPYTPPILFLPEPHSVALSEPLFFPSGSSYHGIISVDASLPTTIPRLQRSGGAQPAVFFLEPLEGDTVGQGEGGITIQTAVQNFQIWEGDESEPEGLSRGHVALTINGRLAAKCGARVCSFHISRQEDGPLVAKAQIYAPDGREVGEAATVAVFACGAGMWICEVDMCGCG